jgi:hypothetical protein
LYTVKTGTAAPDSHSAQGEAHHVESLPPLAVPVLVALCTIKLLLHLFTSVRHYGYFRDELYYLDMARHLDWGYVEGPATVREGFGQGRMVLADDIAVQASPHGQLGSRVPMAS